MDYKTLLVKVILIILLLFTITPLIFASNSNLEEYLIRQIAKDENILNNDMYRMQLLEKTKTKFYNISKLSSYGSYQLRDKKLEGTVELGFYLQLFDFKKKVEIEISKNELYNQDLTEEYIIQNIISNHLNEYFEYVRYREMAAAFDQFLSLVDKNALDREEILIYDELRVSQEQNILVLAHLENDDFKLFYDLFGMEIFKDELYYMADKENFYEKLIKNNIGLNKMYTDYNIETLRNKQTYSYPKIYVDGSYRYNFGDENPHEVKLSMNMNTQFSTNWNMIDLDLFFDKDKISYTLSSFEYQPDKHDDKINIEIKKQNFIRSAEVQFSYYLKNIELIKKRINISQTKLDYYSESCTNNIKSINSYLNEKLVYLNQQKELNNYYLLILFFGSVSDVMSYLR